MADMASDIGVSTSYVSSIERGIKSVRYSYAKKIIDRYGLDRDATIEIEMAFRISRVKLIISLRSATEDQRRLAFRFENSLQLLDKGKIEAIFKIMDSSQPAYDHSIADIPGLPEVKE